MHYYLPVPEDQDVSTIAHYIREHFPFQGSDVYCHYTALRRIVVLDLAEIRPLYQTWLTKVKELGYISEWQSEQEMWQCAACQSRFMRGWETPADLANRGDSHEIMHLCEACRRHGWVFERDALKVWRLSPADVPGVRVPYAQRALNPWDQSTWVVKPGRGTSSQSAGSAPRRGA